jgi:plastocyanin
MVSRTIILAVVIVAILVVSGAYYFTGVIGTGAANSVTINVSVTNGNPANGAADAFVPNNFTVTEGQHVTIVFQNGDDGPHELAIPAFNVNTQVVQGGQTQRVTFTPNQVGTFKYYEPPGVCSQGAAGAACTGKQLTNGTMTVLAP